MSYPPANDPSPQYGQPQYQPPPGYTGPSYPQPSTPMGPPQYGQPQFGGNYPPQGYIPAAPPQNGLAITSMILGIVGIVLSIFFIGLIGSILAVIFGHISLNQIKRSNGAQQGRGFAIAGLIMGYIVVALFAIIILISIVAHVTRAGQ